MKKCCVCEELKPLSDFYSCKDSKDGYRYVCKRCDAIRKFYRSNKTSRTHRLQIGQLRFLKYVAYYGTECPICGKRMTNIFCEGDSRAKTAVTIDRIVPKAKGGSMAKSNLWLLCRSCNSSKGSKDLHEFLDERGLNLNFRMYDPSLPGDSLTRYWKLLAHQFNNTSKSINDKVAEKFTKNLDVHVPVELLYELL